jgi:hypothetical protein
MVGSDSSMEDFLYKIPLQMVFGDEFPFPRRAEYIE